MPASPLYDRLTDVSKLDYSDPDAGMISKVQSQITSIRESCTTFTQNTGLQGATQAAMTQWVADFHAKLDALEARLQAVSTAHTEARAAMTTAKSTHGTLSPELLHPSDYAAARHLAGGEPNAAEIQREYLENLAVQRNTQREAAAQAALDTMNSGVHSASSGFSQEAADANAAKNSGGAPDNNGSAGNNAPAGRGPSGRGAAPSAATGGPIAGVTTLPSVSPSSSILAGVDVTTMPVGGYMTADGPVGGHIPAPVTDANDPRWRDDYDPFGQSSRSKNLAITGGALSTGGVLAGLGRMSSMTTSVGSSMGALASRAASSQFGTVPAGGQLAPSTSARLSSSNMVSRVLNDLERGALTPRGTAQAGNWGNAARVANAGAPPATGAARTGSGFPRGIGAPGATGAAGAGTSAQGGAASTNRAATMSARARAAASIRPAGGAATGTTGATGATGSAASASKTGTAGAKGAAGSAKGTSAAAGARTAGAGSRGATTAQGTASASTRGGASSAKGGAAASAKGAASAAKAGSSSASTGVKGSAATAGGNAAAGASAGRAASSAMGRGALGGIPAATASKEEKERAKRQALAGFKAVRVDGVEEQVPVAAGLSAGSAAALKPVAARDQGDQW
ncbi:hypothetical protein [Actinomyces sp. S6-Spd3]|uniref:hypothetical protein n=1 Tax=Actinomyces sp. S6-Spd3 TaxID=1284680 RepID=UPI001F2DBEBC|nr:hypothetical protein [Actinomyces sp. S6-Spd3]